MSRASDLTAQGVREVLVARPAEFAACCRELAHAAVIGWDTEFIGEQTFVPQLCLIQIATEDTLFLIDPLTVGCLGELWPILTDPQRIVICHAAREEIRICQRLCGRLPHGVFDLQIAAGLVGMGHPIGHGALVQKLFGIRLSKGETLTDWKKRPLTSRQMEYAFDDVRYLIPAWKLLVRELEKRGRFAWAKEEFETLIPRSLGEEPGVERWRKLKGLGGLNRRELGIVRELFAWREEKAYEKNRPVRAILRDDLLVEIARREVQSERDLAVVRGLPRDDLSEIVGVLERVRALPIEALPELPPRSDEPVPVTLVASFLATLLQQLALEWELAPALIATTNDLKVLVRSLSRQQPLPDTSPFARGWRSQFILPVLQSILSGDCSVRIGGLTSERPFQLSLDPSLHRTNPKSIKVE
jgi:ribonuclease D